MLNGLTKWIRHLFGSRPHEPEQDEVDALVFSEEPSSTDKKVTALAEKNIRVVPYDENLLERARSQWQFGDWESLVKLEHSTLQHHPDRAKLALLAASGHFQQGNVAVAKELIQLAQNWGCSKHLLGQVLIAGVHNSLGRAAASMSDKERAMAHFGNAVSLVTPGSDLRLVTRARTLEQYSQLGHSPTELLHLDLKLPSKNTQEETTTF
ncbi:hypothetical protein [Azomonas macrocytogenes]|uniref:Tetratricopeptide (TPR) repeat protein n=1 Tax=Azomonas macrocytogenes TaxID=69962 RepID=A0A839T0E4_AZOMA|nr:hypothetical protein [Azomonas macrocytogenes]MBB3102459.1 tetratricopeptide (TPR) repeat protein [Azomonas macrocytogenes]